jgi:endonuclease-3 related protein
MEATTQGQALAVVKRSSKPSRGPRSGTERAAEEKVRRIYRKLSRAWGPQHWWPAETPFEVIVGAILTQNTSWTNVESALGKLRTAGVLSLPGIRNLSAAELEVLVRSSGYFRQKAARLKDLVAFVDADYDGSLNQMFAAPTEQLRSELLGQKGIGMETADSILLYAGLHPIFVVDAYTRRILERHDIIPRKAKYDDIRLLVERALAGEDAVVGSREGRLSPSRPTVHMRSAMSAAQQPARTKVYNEMHGLMVQIGKHYCHKQRPKCDHCPLAEFLTEEQRVRLLSADSYR